GLLGSGMCIRDSAQEPAAPPPAPDSEPADMESSGDAPAKKRRRRRRKSSAHGDAGAEGRPTDGDGNSGGDAA
ncbi:hypothetical protein OEZ83_25880, partial [Leclercia adecarboxylata]|uniref:hypothetical protein n=1 Tax=Leclercia adecarboxylata TaxID=83655 RepID=UPI00234CFA7E